MLYKSPITSVEIEFAIRTVVVSERSESSNILFLEVCSHEEIEISIFIDISKRESCGCGARIDFKIEEFDLSNLSLFTVVYGDSVFT
jgi:hypothetical protein